MRLFHLPFTNLTSYFPCSFFLCFMSCHVMKYNYNNEYEMSMKEKLACVFFFLEGGSLSRYNLIIEIVIHSLSCCSLFSFLLFCRFLSLAREKGIYFLIDRKKEGIMSIIYWNGWILWFFFCIISSLRTDLLGGIRLMVKQFVKLSWVKFGSQKFKFHQFRQLKLVQKCATSLKTYKSLPLSPNSSIYLQQQKSIQLSVKSTLLLL